MILQRKLNIFLLAIIIAAIFLPAQNYASILDDTAKCFDDGGSYINGKCVIPKKPAPKPQPKPQKAKKPKKTKKQTKEKSAPTPTQEYKYTPQPAAEQPKQSQPPPAPTPQFETYDGTGIMYIVSSPDGTELYIEGAYKGVTPLTIKNMYSGKYKVQLKKDGYETKTFYIEVDAGGGNEMKLTKLEFAIDRSTGAIIVRTDRDPASVYLDGTYIRESPVKIEKVATGKHALKVKSGELEKNYEADVSRNAESQINVAFAEMVGGLTVMSDPLGAKVYLDGNDKGEAPMTITEIPEGTHNLKMETKDGELGKTADVTVTGGETKLVEWKLETLFGNIGVMTTPSGAQAYLDGSYKGESPLTIEKLKEGRYTIRTVKEDYKDMEKTVNVNPGDKVSVNIELFLAVGSIEVMTTPSGAKVYLDGSYQGESPMTIEKLKEGRYTIKVDKNEYESSEKTVDVKAGEKMDLRMELKKSLCPSGFAYIAPGTFMMGSPLSEEGRDNDEIQHQVTISKGFCMGKYEMTQGEWEAVMGSNPSGFKNCGSNCPVENVSWNDVKEFIRKYNAANGGGYRLPTEAEWEYAARGGTTSAFYTGNITETGCGYDPALIRAGWYCGNSGNTTHPVGQKEVNAWGLYDMLGNVWEWVEDWQENYPSGTVTDPVGTSSGSFRVLRGGGWNDGAGNCRSADRLSDAPGYRNGDLGFRLVRTLP